MNAIHIAAFIIILTTCMNVIPLVLGWPIGWGAQDYMGVSQDFVQDESYPYPDVTEGQRGDSIGQGDFIGGLWGFATIVFVGAAVPGVTFTQLIGCGASCGWEVGLLATMFTGIVWFIYGIAILQIISGRSFKSME